MIACGLVEMPGNVKNRELLTLIHETANEMCLNIDGAYVAKGVDMIPAVKGPEGTALAIYWRSFSPVSYLFRELYSHWNVKMALLSRDLKIHEYESVSCVMFYRTNSATLLADDWMQFNSRQYRQANSTQTTVVAPPGTPNTTAYRCPYSWLDRARGVAGWSLRHGGTALGEVVGEALGNMVGAPTSLSSQYGGAVGEAIGRAAGQLLDGGFPTSTASAATNVTAPDDADEFITPPSSPRNGSNDTMLNFHVQRSKYLLNLQKSLDKMPKEDGKEGLVKTRRAFCWRERSCPRETTNYPEMKSESLHEKCAKPRKRNSKAGWTTTLWR